MILLDTDVMVDILRGHEPAKTWLASVEEIGSLVWWQWN